MAEFIVSFVYENYFCCKQIEENEILTIGSGKSDGIFYEKLKPKQFKIKINNGNFIVENNLDKKCDSSPLSVPNYFLVSGENNCYFFVDFVKKNLPLPIELPHNAKLTVGRKSTNDVVIKSCFVSGEQCIISRRNGIFYVENLSRQNGTFVNNIRISKINIKSGDTIYISSYRIKLESGLLYFENCGDEVSVKKIEGKETNYKGTAHKEGERRIYHRSPRTQEALPSEDIILAAPPSKKPKYEKRRGMLGSIIGTAAMTGTSMLTGGAVSAAMLAARSSMLIMPATSLVSQNSDNKRNKKKSNDYEKLRELRFGNYLNEQRTRIASVAKQQVKIKSDENPSPEECLEITVKMKRNLWERNPSDRDFLDVRLGMGYEKLCINVKDRSEAYGVEMEDDEAKKMSEMLVAESKYVDNIPVRLSFTENNTIGFIGNIRQQIINQVKNMVAEIACMHCYSDVKIVGIFDAEEKEQWESIRWLPHIWDDDRQVRYLAFDQESSHALCESFNDMLKARKRDIKDSPKNNIPVPYYIFIFGSEKYMEHEEIMKNLDIDKKDMGVTSLFLFNNIFSLPSYCRYIVDFNSYPAAYRKDEINSKFLFSPDNFSEDSFEYLSRSMAAIELKGFSDAADIPDSVTFLEGYGVNRVEDLNILERWNSNFAYKSLAAPIGVGGGEKTFYLNIRESKGSPDEHGPHGLVAGTTGSGKSELLQTWILSMCVNYHPNEVNFVLIDYKGGGMANLLENMPHVVGKITNIASNIKRSVISLNREKDRRMEIFAAAGSDVNNIDKYHKLYHAGKVKEPLPHLIIVADEFAELKKEEPEFIADLVTIARVGRTLGIHLVLATQKPSGIVDDQISGNSRFRLCLKVQDSGDSREMIGRPDASHITRAGRCYAKVGDYEVFELFQSYWSGAEYSGTDKTAENKENQAAIVDYSGKRNYSPRKKNVKKAELDELGAINRYICSLAEENNIKQLQGPWLEELPANLSLESIVSKEVLSEDFSFSSDVLPWLKIPVGKFDMPELQKQGTMYMDFCADGHYGIYGASGTGKTTFLKTMIVSACMHYSPEDINFYIFDCGGWSLNSMADFPHVGDIVLDVEEEKIKKLQELLSEKIDERRKLFLENKVSSLSAYREIVGKLPAIVLVIDNILPVFDNFPDFEELLIRISRDGATYGIYLCYTANTNAGIRYKVLQNVKGAVTFELTDKGDYSGIVGRMDGKFLPSVSGRAFMKAASPVEFQTAWFAQGSNEVQRVAAVQSLEQKMNNAWQGYVPDAVPVMPNVVTSDMLTKHYREKNKIPMGISYKDIKTECADFYERYGMIVCGSINSGKSVFLKKIALMLSASQNNDLYFIDSRKHTFSELYPISCAWADDTDAQGIRELIGGIARIMNERKNEQNELDAKGVQPLNYGISKNQICIFIDDIKEFTDIVEEELQQWMVNIASYAQGLGVIIIAAIRTADLANMAELESLTHALAGYQHAVQLDGSPADTLCFSNNLSFNEKSSVCEKGDAWLFDGGECKKIKLAQ